MPRIDASLGVRKLLGTLFLDLAMSDALLSPARFPSPGVLVSVPHRLALSVPAGVDIEFRNGGAHVHEQPVVLETDRFVPLRSGGVLALIDDNPIALEEAHPEKGGNALDLGGRPAGQWTRALDQAVALVDTYLPALGEDLRLFVQQFIPVGFDDRTHLSASYREALGTIYLSLHPNPMTMAEAVIHELCHNKLHALMELDPLLENGLSPLFGSPVRPDPRPLQGILLAVHAFVPVERLYGSMVEADHPWSRVPDFKRRLAEIQRGNRDAVAVLVEHAEATPIGKALVDELARLCG